MASASIYSFPAPDAAAMTSFLAGSIGEAIHLVAIKPDSEDVHSSWFGSDAEAAAAWAFMKNSQGRNVYWTVNIVSVGFGRKPKKTNIIGARFLHVDLDPPKDGSAFDRKEVLGRLQNMRHPPSFALDSGNGVQAFWRLDEVALNLPAVEGYNRRLAHMLGGDHCHNIDRLMRVPGSVNYPDQCKQDRGRIPALATVMSADEGSFVEAEEMHSILPELPDDVQDERVKIALGDVGLRTLESLGISTVDMLHALIVAPPADKRSETVLKVAGMMARRGFSNAEIAGVLLNPEYRISDHPFDQPDPRRCVRRALERAAGDHKREQSRGNRDNNVASGGVGEQSHRMIKVRAGELPRMATEGEQALIEAGAPIYARGGGLVRPITELVAASRGGKTRIARLSTVTVPTLCDHLARVATWVKYNSRKKEDVMTDVPTEVSTTILSRDGEWELPKLAGVITTPTLRPDGTVLSQPGYDAATQLLLLAPPKLPPIPDNPTKADADTALKILGELLVEFPFVDEASRSVALSALITPVVRGALSVVPLHAITAPVPGSGKSYIVDLASVIATGDRAPVIAAGRNEEETEKRLVSALLGAQPIVSIDNVNGELGGDMLCQMIERPLVDVRILGQSRLVKIESRATTYATGNNIRLLGDMTRRAMLCSLDPDMERPELRQFKGNPVAAVIADRARYIAAALIVVRAYVVADFPDQLPALASFEDWSRLVRSSLVWLGCVDPLETMNKARGEDPVTSTLTALFSHWYEAADGIARTAGQVKQLAFEKDMAGNPIRTDFAEALTAVAEGRGGDVSPAKLGRFLSSYQGRIVDGLKLTFIEDGHNKQKLWKVVRHV